MRSAVVVGTGFAGLGMGIRLKLAGYDDFVILEKGRDLGGTWRENTYPGAECDVPSVLYSFSFEPWPHWENKWSHQDQILEYLRHCVTKYDLHDHIRYGREVTGARFDEVRASWKVETAKGERFEARSLVMGIGQLHHPSTPTIPGAERFAGPQFHSARWDHDAPIEGHRVGVVGTAASAVQLIPQIAKTAERVTVFQRTPNWVIPKLDRPYTPWEKAVAKRTSLLSKLSRFQIWAQADLTLFAVMQGNRTFQRLFEAKTRSFLEETIPDPGLREELVPAYPVGAKRILFSDDYYPALARENVDLVTDPVREIVEDGVVVDDGADGAKVPLDTIVYATGFRTNPFLLGLDVRGRGGATIRESWSRGAEAYLGLAVSGFPNLFLLYGPNTNLGHNSIIFMLECQTRWVAQAMLAMDREGLAWIDVKPDVQRTFVDEMQRRLETMAWNEIDASWYKDGDRITNNWPGRTTEYWRRTRRVRLDDFDCRPRDAAPVRVTNELPSRAVGDPAVA